MDVQVRGQPRADGSGLVGLWRLAPNQESKLVEILAGSLGLLLQEVIDCRGVGPHAVAVAATSG